MPTVRIDGSEIPVEPGTTLLQAAAKLGITIPGLCSTDGLEPFTSCMLCVVEESATGKLLPACSAAAADGMSIESNTEPVRAARRAVLELLLAEHVGDCDAPCTRACPLDIDIPEVMRLVREGRSREALGTIRRATAFPALLSRLCTAPCESACRRGKHDEAVAIRRLMQVLADGESPIRTPARRPATESPEMVVAVIGAGAAGLSAAYHLSLEGHLCRLFEAEDGPGGSIRGYAAEHPPLAAGLERDLGFLDSTDVDIQSRTRIGGDDLKGIVDSHDGVLIAAGEGTPDLTSGSSVLISPWGADKRTAGAAKYRTSIAKVFAAGSAVKPGCSLMEAIAQGKAAAACVAQYLKGVPVTGPGKRFQSYIGRLQEGEVLEFLAGAADIPRFVTDEDSALSAGAMTAEASRCFQCDCGKKESCRLRTYAEEYALRRRPFQIGERSRFERVLQHPDVVYEPGKCIKCGICVRITAAESERLGLAFLNRGYDLRVGVPFGELLSCALEISADRCVRSCPTGALYTRRKSDVQ